MLGRSFSRDTNVSDPSVIVSYLIFFVDTTVEAILWALCLPSDGLLQTLVPTRQGSMRQVSVRVQ